MKMKTEQKNTIDLVEMKQTARQREKKNRNNNNNYIEGKMRINKRIFSV